LTIQATNDYVNAVAASGPIAYWRLDETNGTTANDAFGQHQGVYINANIGQPGFSAATGSDLAITVPANASQKGYMAISNASPDFRLALSVHPGGLGILNQLLRQTAPYLDSNYIGPRQRRLWLYLARQPDPAIYRGWRR